jgi:hypothetical protein
MFFTKSTQKSSKNQRKFTKSPNRAGLCVGACRTAAPSAGLRNTRGLRAVHRPTGPSRCPAKQIERDVGGEKNEERDENDRK